MPTGQERRGMTFLPGAVAKAPTAITTYLVRLARREYASQAGCG